MCDRVFSKDPFSTVLFPDKYQTQRMCDEAADDFLAALKLIPDWFVTIKMIKKLFKVKISGKIVGFLTFFNEIQHLVRER